MKKILPLKLTAAFVALVTTGIALLSSANAQSAKPDDAVVKPTVAITVVPPRGDGAESSGTIAGTVTNADAANCRIVIYCLTDQWWVQPTAASPLTEIGTDGKWEAEIHLGYEYAVMLVTPQYNAPATLGKGRLPPVSKSVLAITRVKATKP